MSWGGFTMPVTVLPKIISKHDTGMKKLPHKDMQWRKIIWGCFIRMVKALTRTMQKHDYGLKKPLPKELGWRKII